MNCPEEISPLQTDFDTLIRVKLKDENNAKETSIKNQLEQPFYKALLFLPNIEKIEVQTDENTKIYEKICENSKVLLQESNDVIHEYYVSNKEIILTNTNNRKKANLMIAVPLDKNYDFSNETLYCYFPIRNFPAPIHALIHAPFQTNNSRDDVPNDDKQINKKLLENCLVFAKEVAEKIANDRISDIDLPITALSPINNFSGKIWNPLSFNLKDYYINLMAGARLLPTVNNELISIDDKPKYIAKNFPSEFKNKLFSNLLIGLENDVYKFILELAKTCQYYELDLLYSSYKNLYTLKQKINTLASNFDITTSVKIFLWWSNYTNLWRSNYTNRIYGIPNLLKDTNNNWIKEDSKIYLPTDTGVSILPKSLAWVNLCILHKNYVNELIKQIQTNYLNNWNEIKQGMAEKTADKRILDKYSDKYFPINFKEQSSSELVIEEINKQIDNEEKSITFLNWFFETYKDKYHENSSLNKINYNFLNRKNQIATSQNLFFGNEYQAELSEKIFSLDSNYSALAPISKIFKGKEVDKGEFIQFLNKCGVSYFPTIKERDLCLDNKFNNFIRKKYSFSQNINYLVVKTIDNLQNILQKLSTDEIVQWIERDINLNNLIQANDNFGYFSQKSNTYRTHINSNEFVKYLFNNTSWIELDGKKYAPNHIVKYSKLGNKINGIYGISENDLINKLNKKIVIDYKFEFKNLISELPDETLRMILEELPIKDINGEISRTLYEDIIKNKKELLPTYNISNIRLLCFDGQFRLNKDIKYAQQKIQRKENNESNLIYIQPKRNAETIKNWFGVEKYKTNLKLDNYTILENNQEFENEIKELKIATLSSMNETNNYITKLKNLTIIPCTYLNTVNIENDNEKFELEDYNYIKNNGEYFIKIPQTYDNNVLEQSVEFSNNIIEILEDAVSFQIDKNLIGRLISSSSKNKKLIIDDQFGIDRWNYIQELLFTNTKFNKKIVNWFKEQGLLNENLQKISKIDFTKTLSHDDYITLKDSCKNVNKDIKDILTISNNVNIDIRHNLAKEFYDYKETKLAQFKFALFKTLKNQTEQQCNFLNCVNKFRCYELNINDVENSVFFDSKEVLNKILKNEFNDINLEDYNNIDFNNIYDNNYIQCVSEININNEDLDYILKTNIEINSMLYFGVTEKLKTLINNILTKIKESETQEKNSNISTNSQTTTIETLLTPKDKKTKSTTIKSEMSEKQYEKININNETNGKKAEEIAYNELKKDYPKIIWHSKNSKIQSDKNNAPIDITCDMWNTDSDGNKTYFEIKSSVSEFNMSINEYNSMKKCQENYIVVLVDIKSNTISLHKFDELDALKEISEYTFIFNQIKK